MPKHIVVVGSGIAGVTFAEEFRKLDADSYLTLLTRETHGYYSRPLLSHAFTRGDIETRIILKSFPALIAGHIGIESGAEVLGIDRAAKKIAFRKLGEDTSLHYDELVLATGSAALVPPPFREQAGLFHVLNSLDDLIELRRLRAEIQRRQPRPRWAVVGGGLIGCEIAADLAKAGDEVTLFHALPRLMERQLVEEDSERLLGVLRGELGVDVRLDQAVEGFAAAARIAEPPPGYGAARAADALPPELAVKLRGGEEGGFQGIIVACGFKPRTELAEAAGLEVRRGIAVNEFLATSDPAIHAIGDGAELPDGRLYAYVTPARNQGLWLAKHLAGQTQEPWHPPVFKPKAKVPGFEAAHPYLF